MLAITNAEILTPLRSFSLGTLLVDGDRIAAIGPMDGVEIPSAAERLDASGLRVLPGFIDRHTHGGGGGSAMEGEAESIAQMAQFLPAHGVTAFLPTLPSSSPKATEHFLTAVQEAMRRAGEGARVLGAHLEGPYLSPEYKGAHEARFLRAPNLPECARLLERFPGVLKLVTLAPELAGARDLIDFLVSNGVKVALGHSNASLEEVEAAVSAGADSITHAYNAMSGLHHRRPGMVGAALALDSLYTEIIADFMHAHPAAVEILLRCKPADKVLLVSDSIPAAGLPEGEHLFAGQKVTVREGAVRLETGRLAGSSLTLELAVANIIRLGRSPSAAVRMATTNAAASLGTKKLGSLRRGAYADFTVVDRNWQVKATFVGGKLAFSRGIPL